MSTFCRTLSYVGEKPVLNGLSLSPSDAYKRTLEGKPVVTSELPASHFEEGSLNCSFKIPLEHQRGVDIATIWESMKDGFKHIKNHVSPYESFES